MAARCPKCDYHLERDRDGFICYLCRIEELEKQIAMLKKLNLELQEQYGSLPTT